MLKSKDRDVVVRWKGYMTGMFKMLQTKEVIGRVRKTKERLDIRKEMEARKIGLHIV